MLDDAQKIAKVNLRLNHNIREHVKNTFDDIRYIQTPYGEFGEIMYHIFDSVDYWLDIMKNEESSLKKYSELRTPKEFFDEWIRVDNRLIDYLENNNTKENLQRTIHIKFSPDEEFDANVEDLLMHISHHSMYHRSTLGAIARMKNLDPLPNATWSFAK